MESNEPVVPKKVEKVKGQPKLSKAERRLARQEQKKSKTPCRNFFRDGHCKWGSECVYSHDLSNLSICKYYNDRGGCRRGDSCTYRHELSNYSFFRTPKLDSAARLVEMIKLKEAGNALFRSKHWEMAYMKYKAALDLVEEDSPGTEEYEVMISCHCNAAQACNKLGAFATAANHCTSVLVRDKRHRKALYHRIIAMCHLGFKHHTIVQKQLDLFLVDSDDAESKQLTSTIRPIVPKDLMFVDADEAAYGALLLCNLLDKDYFSLRVGIENMNILEIDGTPADNNLFGRMLAHACIIGSVVLPKRGGEVISQEEVDDMSGETEPFEPIIDHFPTTFRSPRANKKRTCDVLQFALGAMDRCRRNKILRHVGFDPIKDKELFEKVSGDTVAADRQTQQAARLENLLTPKLLSYGGEYFEVY